MITVVDSKHLVAYNRAICWGRKIFGVFAEEYYGIIIPQQGMSDHRKRCIPAIQMAALWIRIGERMKMQGIRTPRFSSTYTVVKWK